MITPLTADEEIDVPGLRRMIGFLIKNGVHGIFIIGSTGEFYALSENGRRKLIETTMEEAARKVPVYVGTGGITTRDCIKWTHIAEEYKVDAVSVLTPMFVSPSQDELVEHFRRIATETSLPVILYNNVPRTGVNISTDTVEKLSLIPNIVGIKDSSGDFTLTAEYLRLTRHRKDFAVLQGRDTQILAGLAYGAKGAIAACANAAPRICCDIYNKFLAGDYAGALEAQFALAPLRIAFNLGTFPAVIKDTLNFLGLDIGGCAKPVNGLTDEEKNQLKIILQDMQLM
jgi:4-hydroxy-tetrahydrodipicolinate synthase